MSIFYRAKAFFRLPAIEKRLLFEAYATLGMMRAAIAFLPFKKIVGSAEARVDCEPPNASEDELVKAAIIGRAISRASRYTPWKSACLAQGLTAQSMLRRRGIGSVLFLGARLGDGREDRLGAHAWVVCGDQAITGGKEAPYFQIVACFVSD